MKAIPEDSDKANNIKNTNSPTSFDGLPSVKSCTSSKEEMVFDYFDSSDSRHKLKPQTCFEMKTFSSSEQLPGCQGKKYANNLSGRIEDPYSIENSTHDYINQGGIHNGLIVEENLLRSSTSSASYHVRLYDDDELQQAVVEDSARKYLATPHDQASGSTQRLLSNVGERVAFFPKAIPASQVMSMESSSRADGLGELHSRSIQNFNISSEGEELVQVDSSLKVQTTLNSPFMSTVSSNCLTNLICSIKPNGHPNDRTEVNKRMQRRDIKKKQMMRKTCEYRSEDIPEYMGKLPLDEIMAFIDDTKVQRVSVQSLNKSLKKDDLRMNKIKCLATDNTDVTSGGAEQGGILLSSTTVTELIPKESQEFDDAVTMVVEVASLATSSSTSSFRTASPPDDIPQTTFNLDFYKPEVQLTPLHSPTTQKEFITVQKKKKLKQSTPIKNAPALEAAPFSTISEVYNWTVEQQSKLTGKPLIFNGRQAGFRPNFRGGFSANSPKNFLTCDSSSLKPDDNNNSILVKVPSFSRTPFTEKQEIPIDSIQKSESQFDPSQFPELSGSGRRNSTGSSAPKNSEESSKGFAFSYADIAAKLRQKKHSSDKQRRNSLQLTCQKDSESVIDSDDFFKDQGPQRINELTSLSDSSQNSVLCTEFADIPTSKEDLTNNSSDYHISRPSLDSFQSPSDLTDSLWLKTNPLCKEPVVFLDGRKNLKVTDLVFIFDPTIPPGQPKKFDPATPEPEEFEIKESPEVTKEQKNVEARNTSPSVGNNLHFSTELDSAEDTSSHQFSPGFVSVTHPIPNSRPSPLSNNYSTGRQVVKVSPMPIVAPAVPVDRLQKNMEIESKPSTHCINSSLLLPTIGNSLLPHKNLFNGRFTSSVQRNLFDLCKAQMFLYAGFEECLKESKNNPTNVVVYSE